MSFVVIFSSCNNNVLLARDLTLRLATPPSVVPHPTLLCKLSRQSRCFAHCKTATGLACTKEQRTYEAALLMWQIEGPLSLRYLCRREAELVPDLCGNAQEFLDFSGLLSSFFLCAACHWDAAPAFRVLHNLHHGSLCLVTRPKWL